MGVFDFIFFLFFPSFFPFFPACTAPISVLATAETPRSPASPAKIFFLPLRGIRRLPPNYKSWIGYPLNSYKGRLVTPKIVTWLPPNGNVGRIAIGATPGILP